MTKFLVNRSPRYIRPFERAERELLTDTIEEEVEKTLSETRKELLPCTTGPYTVKSVTDTLVNIKKDGFTISMSFDRVTRVPGKSPLLGDATLSQSRCTVQDQSFLPAAVSSS